MCKNNNEKHIKKYKTFSTAWFLPDSGVQAEERVGKIKC